MNLEILGIIPARGGSKTLPKKNIKEICGKPLIAHTVEASKLSGFINRTVVSTDDVDIADISKQYGAEIPYIRPSELAGDLSPTIDAIVHMVRYLDEYENYNPDYIVLLQPTSPLRNHKHIDACIEKLLNSDSDAIVSVCESEVNPYWSQVFENNKLRYFIEDGKNITRRQDLPNVYRINGAIYCIKTDVLLEFNTLEPENLTGYIMSNKESIDIDDELDFKIAKVVMEELR